MIDLNTTIYIYNLSYPANNLTVGNHTLNITDSDGHTNEKLKYREAWGNSNCILNDCLQFKWKEPYKNGRVKINGESIFDNFVANEQSDRYSFTYTPYHKNKKEYTFTVESDSIIYIKIKPESIYKEWLVIDDKWLDFYTSESDIEITRLSATSVSVTLTSKSTFKDKIIFNSIGDLNTFFRSYDFTKEGDTSNLNITAYSNSSGLLINNFTVYINGILWASTTIGYYYKTNLSVGNYNITIDAPNYVLASKLISMPNASNYTMNFSLYDTNSITFTVYDENSAAHTTKNITATFTSTNGSFMAYSKSAVENYTVYKSNITPQTYTVLFTASTYEPRTYMIIVGERSTQTMNVYLTNTTSNTIFTVSDKDSNEILSDVACTMYKSIGESWQPVESKFSDITGKAQFTYVTYTNYKFLMTKNGYDNKIFYLNPILYTSYDVKLTRQSIINYSQDFDTLSIIYSPDELFNGTENTFSVLFNAPYGNLISYGATLTYPGGSNSSSDTNAQGSQLTMKVTPRATSAEQTAVLNYFYYTTTAGNRSFRTTIPIRPSTNSSSDMTFMSNRDKTYGLGIFERLLITTLIVLFVCGIATLVGQPIPGFALALFMFGYIYYIGFVPLWVILPSMFVGFLILAWKSGAY
jgi:hypothetical protein